VSHNSCPESPFHINTGERLCDVIAVATPYRKMRDPAFRAEQHRGIRLPHIAKFNDLVDKLRAEPGQGWMPYIAPLYGGTESRVLSVFQDPGPKTDDADGSGMLCVENDDPAAQYMSELLAGAGIPPSELIPWNATKLTAAHLNAGIEPLRRVIELMEPRLRVVMLHGGAAHEVWDRLARRHPGVARQYSSVRTYHTARTTFRSKDPAVREHRRQHLRDAFAQAAAELRADDAT
jgi:hypothetical protein